MSNYVVGDKQTHYLGKGDAFCRCPKCFGNNVETIGTLTIDGTPHPSYKCITCNCAFSGTDGGIASMVQEAKQEYGTGRVGFTGILGTVGSASLTGVTSGLTNSNVITNQPPVTLDYNALSKLDSINYSIQNLMTQIQGLVQQNKELMNKLQSDPLISIKKAVSEFNLK